MHCIIVLAYLVLTIGQILHLGLDGRRMGLFIRNLSLKLAFQGHGVGYWLGQLLRIDGLAVWQLLFSGFSTLCFSWASIAVPGSLRNSLMY